MKNKAYIVANEEQEREVLEKLEREGYLWGGTDMRPTEKHRLIDEPITIFARDDKRLTFDYEVNEAYLADYEIEIDFDGRKEKHMSEKYVVSQEFMNELEEWKDNLEHNGKHSIYDFDIQIFSNTIEDWWCPVGIRDYEQNNRLIAIIRWVNGEDVFEVEKPKKWVVRSKEADNKGNYMYGYIVPNERLKYMEMVYSKYPSAYFDTKEEAESWANSHQEVVEVDE